MPMSLALATVTPPVVLRFTPSRTLKAMEKICGLPPIGLMKMPVVGRPRPVRRFCRARRMPAAVPVGSVVPV